MYRFALLLLLPSLAAAEPLVRDCGDPNALGKVSTNWTNCTPSLMTWQRFGPEVLIPARQVQGGGSVWKRGKDVQPTEWLTLCDHLAVGSKDSCYQKTRQVLASTVMAPLPTPPPTVEYTDKGILTWTVDATDPVKPTGFRIEYGLAGVFDKVVVVGDVRSHTIANLPPGTWNFRVRALAGAAQSDPSPVSTKVIAAPIPVPEPPADVWRVAPIASGVRPIYEAVANADSSAWVRGNPEGRAEVGTLCGAEAFRVGTNSYRELLDADVLLDSPTYRGRRHVAICIR